MSVEAITWAFSQPIRHSTAKFLLVAMANHADADMCCWPSMPHLIAQTAQDRKTVQENIRRLREMGYIEDIGERKGATKQVIVYRLKTPENGPVEHAQKRGALEEVTGPIFPPNRPVFPTKEARFSHVTGPKTGPGTINEPSIEPSRNHQAPAKKKAADDFCLPAWVPAKAWEGYIEMRRVKRKAPTDRARDLVIAELLKLHDAGQDIEAVLNKSIVNGWTDVYAIKQPIVKPGQQQDKTSRDADNQAAYQLLFGKRQSEVIDV